MTLPTKREAWALHAMCNNLCDSPSHWARENAPSSEGWYLYKDLAKKLKTNERNLSKIVRPLVEKEILEFCQAGGFDERNRPRTLKAFRIRRDFTTWKVVIAAVKKMIMSGRYAPSLSTNLTRQKQVLQFLKSDYVEGMVPDVQSELVRAWPGASDVAILQFWITPEV